MSETFKKLIELNFFEMKDATLQEYLSLCNKYEDLINRIKWKLYHVCERKGHKMIIEDGIIKCKRCGRDISRW